MRALRRKGLAIQPFKCGPDYIDPAHHRAAAGRPSRNLDCWMMGEDGARLSFRRAAAEVDCAVVEGVMGLFDGACADRIDGSTAHIARLLGIPVVLVVDARAMARSLAAIVHGFATFEPGVSIIGVVANNVSTQKHERLLSDALTAARLPPLLGAVPREKSLELPERHLGLLPAFEATFEDGWHERLADLVERHIDIGRLLDLTMLDAPPSRDASDQDCQAQAQGRSPRLGVAMDEAFNFYYEDNLDLLRRTGVEIVAFSPLKDGRLPEGLDGLYIGGGFPEVFAGRLERNQGMRMDIKAFADSGGFIFAECGGLMYLCENIEDKDGGGHAMCGVLPAAAKMGDRLRRLGYVEAKTASDSFLGPSGTLIRGHEFHWSDIESTAFDRTPAPAFMARGVGVDAWTPMGFSSGNVVASYFHAHFLSNPAAVASWADAMRTKRRNKTTVSVMK